MKSENKLKQLISDKYFLIQVLVFVVIQPFLDMYRIFIGDRIQVFGISLVEIINIAIVAYLAILFLIKYRKQPKYYVPLFAYGAVFLLYFILHIWNYMKFDVTILSGAEFNIFKELYIIIRVYLVPIVIFYFLLCTKSKISCFKKVTRILSGLISGVIVFTNIFKVAFIAYASAFETNQMIEKNIFDWFFDPCKNASFMTSKGWFFIGNQIGIILFMLFPVIIMCAVKSRSKFDYVLVALQSVAMIMVGTKVAALGCILILAATIIILLFFEFILKRIKFTGKERIGVALFIVCVIFLFANSPIVSMNSTREEAFEVTGDEEELRNDLVHSSKDIENGKATKSQIKKFAKNVEKYHYSYGIAKEFVELFSVEDNYQFWFNIINRGGNAQMNYRNFKLEIYEEVLRKNDVKFDRALGIGYNSNFPYIERDFASQNVWFGYVGTIVLIGPYYLCVLWALLQIVKKLKTHFTIENLCFLMSICGATLLSYMAGHLFNGVFSITIFAWIVSGFVHYQKETEKSQTSNRELI